VTGTRLAWPDCTTPVHSYHEGLVAGSGLGSRVGGTWRTRDPNGTRGTVCKRPPLPSVLGLFVRVQSQPSTAERHVHSPHLSSSTKNNQILVYSYG
jgi:hypothetical protein